jgi:hypothetical protein
VGGYDDIGYGLNKSSDKRVSVCVRVPVCVVLHNMFVRVLITLARIQQNNGARISILDQLQIIAYLLLLRNKSLNYWQSKS